MKGGGRVKKGVQADITEMTGPEGGTEVLSKCGGKHTLNNFW